MKLPYKKLLKDIRKGRDILVFTYSDYSCEDIYNYLCSIIDDKKYLAINNPNDKDISYRKNKASIFIAYNTLSLRGMSFDKAYIHQTLSRDNVIINEMSIVLASSKRPEIDFFINYDVVSK